MPIVSSRVKSAVGDGLSTPLANCITWCCVSFSIRSHRRHWVAQRRSRVLINPAVDCLAGISLRDFPLRCLWSEANTGIWIRRHFISIHTTRYSAAVVDKGSHLHNFPYYLVCRIDDVLYSWITLRSSCLTYAIRFRHCIWYCMGSPSSSRTSARTRPLTSFRHCFIRLSRRPHVMACPQVGTTSSYLYYFVVLIGLH